MQLINMKAQCHYLELKNSDMITKIVWRNWRGGCNRMPMFSTIRRVPVLGKVTPLSSTYQVKMRQINKGKPGYLKKVKAPNHWQVVSNIELMNTSEASPTRLTSLTKIDTTVWSNRNPNCKRIGARIEWCPTSTFINQLTAAFTDENLYRRASTKS